MKNNFSIVLLSMFVFSANAQDLNFSIRGNYSRSITAEQLEKANLLTDFIDGYPSSWISEYVSVNVVAVNKGLTQIEIGQDLVLTEQQKSILSNADLASDIEINVNYIAKNTFTEKNENKKMTVKMSIIPEIQAEFQGGKEKQSQYFKDNLINKIPKSIVEELKKGVAVFSVNENGEITNTKLKTSSGDATMDKILIEAINNMPKWKPAANSKGQKLNQEFEFSLGNLGC